MRDRAAPLPERSNARRNRIGVLLAWCFVLGVGLLVLAATAVILALLAGLFFGSWG